MSKGRSQQTDVHAQNVLLSIKPDWADAILSGEKRYEYRRVAPARGPPLRLVLYATAPRQAAVGVAWSYSMLEDHPDVLVEDTVGWTPHDPSDVRSYFEGTTTGYALRIGSYRRFDTPVPREDLVGDGLAPAQNFRYIGTVAPDESRVEPQKIHG